MASESADLLEYESKILVDSFSDDSLFIFARGLGIERFFLHHLKLYSHPKVLVLVINTRSQDEEFLLSNMKLSPGDGDIEPRIITNEISAAERQRTYLKGGVQFVTSRILVVDFLMNRVPADLVSGILVYRAETVLDSFQESFILRMFRERKPKGGFVKAFTDAPTFFNLQEIGQLQRLVSKLFVRKVFFLPRFEADVKICLEKSQPEVVELGIDLSPGMKKIQIAMMEIISACAKELKQCNPGVLLEETETSKDGNDVFSALKDTGMEKKLEGELSQLSEKSRRLLSELRTLRVLLHQMEQLDPVSFYQSISILKNNERAFMSNSGWIFTRAAQTMFSEAEKRVTGKEGIESPPKWQALQNVLKEILDTTKEFQDAANVLEQAGSVLVIAANIPCCKLLADLMANGEKKFLDILGKNLHSSRQDPSSSSSTAAGSDTLISDESAECIDESWWPKDGIKFSTAKKEENGEEEEEERRKLKGGKGKRKIDEKQLTLTQVMDRASSKKKKLQSDPDIIDLDAEEPSVIKSDDNSTRNGGVKEKSDPTSVPTPILTLYSLESRRYELMKTLEATRPTFVILYHSTLDSIRQIEMYKATHDVGPLKVYFLMYKRSVEEQEHLSSLHREKLSFQHLIQESSIVVDMREFRSELPSIIYKRGIEVVPLTIEVGDYILTPDTCVERKSVWDLVGSLQNGRLYKQAQQMLRHYKRAILLIETESMKKSSGGSKRWRGGPFGGEMGPSNRDIRAKLTVLTRQCPNLRIVWSVSPQTTVELFEDLKWQKPEPDPEIISTIKADEIGSGGEIEKYNPTGKKMALKLPGVTEKNVKNLLDHSGSGSFLEICQKLGSASAPNFGKKLKLSPSDLTKIRKFCDMDFKNK